MDLLTFKKWLIVLTMKTGFVIIFFVIFIELQVEMLALTFKVLVMQIFGIY